MRRLSSRMLRDLLDPVGSPASRCIADAETRVPLARLAGRTWLADQQEIMAGASVLLLAARPLNAALMMIELDGLVRRMVLCPPGLDRTAYQATLLDAEIDLVVTDQEHPPDWSGSLPVVRFDARMPAGAARLRGAPLATEWILFTSGTSGRPKLAVHSLASLVGVKPVVGEGAPDTVWSTFYDVRRYGGLQILLRALTSQGSMILSPTGSFDPGFLETARVERVTHLSGTPSHWRLVLSAGAPELPSLKYIRLSGEACDQTLLGQLTCAYPSVSIAHAFASTEAGLVFDVTDRLAGIPMSMLEGGNRSMEIDISTGSLRVASMRCATRYIGCHNPQLRDRDGLIDTGDLVEERQGRLHFLGRRGGIINVGGAKIHPESVESVINQHPAVQISRVHGANSPIIGCIVVGEIVIASDWQATPKSTDGLKSEILELCRRQLPRHHVPVRLKFVPSITLGPAGKMLRNHA